MAIDLADLRVLIVADDPLARAGLATMLDTQRGLRVVGQVDWQDDLLSDVGIFEPEVVLVDLGWDGAAGQLDVDGAEAGTLRDLLQSELPLLALLPDDEQASLNWAAGVRGLLLRDADAVHLAAALVALAQGLAVIDPLLADIILPAVEQQPPTPPHEALTPRELEVLQLLAEGLANKAIALQLGISEHTVKYHVNAILGKLDAQSRTEAVVRAMRLGLIVL